MPVIAAGESDIDENTASQSNNKQGESNNKQGQSNNKQSQSDDYDSEEALDRLARLTLLSQLDIANFVPEVIAVKKRVKGSAQCTRTQYTL